MLAEEAAAVPACSYESAVGEVENGEVEVEVDERKKSAALTLCASSYPKAATPEASHVCSHMFRPPATGVFAMFD